MECESGAGFKKSAADRLRASGSIYWRLERRAKSAECQGESPYEVRLAGRFVPESCATVRKGRREVLTGVSAGEVSSCEIISWRGRCC